MAIKNYYIILGVPRTASPGRIQAAYRDLAKERHPDVAGSDGEEAFREINEAYEILSDPEKRRAHNRDLQRAESMRPPVRHGPGPGSRAPKPIREELHVELVLSPREARQGGVLPVGVPVVRECPACHGAGREWFFPCLRCRQRGWIQTRKIVGLPVPAGIRHGAVIDVSPAHLGIHHLALHLHVVIE